MSLSDVVAGLGDFLLRSSLLLCLAAAMVGIVKLARGPAALRHLIWLCSLVATALLPALGSLLPPLSLGILPPLTPSPAAQTVPAADPTIGGNFVLALYVTMVLLLAFRVPLGRWQLRSAWRAATSDAGVDAEVEALSLRLGVRNAVARLGGPSVMPITWGTRQPRILLPRDFPVWTGERRQSVLVHELGHAVRRDSFGQTVATLICACCWFHPGVWFAAARVHDDQEHACDEFVLRMGVPARRYAGNLLAVAALWEPALPAKAAAAMARPSQLERRLGCIIRGPLPRPMRAVSRGACLAFIAGVAGLTSTFRLDHAAAAPAPQAAAPSQASPPDDASARPAPPARRAAPRETRADVRPSPVESVPTSLRPPPEAPRPREPASTHRLIPPQRPAPVAGVPALEPVPALPASLAQSPILPTAPRFPEPPA